MSSESGCDCQKMINRLNTTQGRQAVSNKKILVLGLGNNDIIKHGVEGTIRQCSNMINYIRTNFTSIQTIGCMALSPRWKPTRFISSEEIGELHMQFNERSESCLHKSVLTLSMLDWALWILEKRMDYIQRSLLDNGSMKMLFVNGSLRK